MHPPPAGSHRALLRNDLADESLEIGAIRRGVVESGSATVPVGVQAPAAHLDDPAVTARGAQSLDATPPGRDHREAGYLVHRMGPYVQAGSGRAVKSGLHRVRLFPPAIGLDDERADRMRADRLGEARAAVD